MKTMAFLMMVVLGGMVMGGESAPVCNNGKCTPRTIIRHAVAVPLRVVHAVVPNCSTECATECVVAQPPAQPAPAVEATCEPCKPVCRPRLLAKLRTKVKSHCCK